MPKFLSGDAAEQYHRDGFYFPIRVLSPAEARGYRDRLEAVDREQDGPLRGALRHKSHIHHFDVEEPPERDLAPEAVARHAAIMQHQGEVLYPGTTIERFR